MKFIMLVEGDTEDKAIAACLKKWLDLQQLKAPVGIKTSRHKGWAAMVSDLGKKPLMYLNDPSQSKDIIAVIGLIDLYGPDFYPQKAVTIEDRYDFAVRHLENKADQIKFHQFLAVHETEAWLLSDPGIFPTAIKNALRKIGEPERINSSEPPAKLLYNLYQKHLGKEYHKKIDGAALFKKLDPQKAYENCPYLKIMLDTMLELAQEAQKTQ